jgi:hypothetical protein
MWSIFGGPDQASGQTDLHSVEGACIEYYDMIHIKWSKIYIYLFIYIRACAPPAQS